jgi:hypothetical protein
MMEKYIKITLISEKVRNGPPHRMIIPKTLCCGKIAQINLLVGTWCENYALKDLKLFDLRKLLIFVPLLLLLYYLKTYYI